MPTPGYVFAGAASVVDRGALVAEVFIVCPFSFRGVLLRIDTRREKYSLGLVAPNFLFASGAKEKPQPCDCG